MSHHPPPLPPPLELPEDDDDEEPESPLLDDGALIGVDNAIAAELHATVEPAPPNAPPPPPKPVEEEELDDEKEVDGESVKSDRLVPLFFCVVFHQEAIDRSRPSPTIHGVH